MNSSLICTLELMKKVTQYSHNELIQGIRESDSNILAFVYSSWFPMIRDYIGKNAGTEEDARDIFQEGMLVLYDKMQARDVEWKSSLKTFLFAVCRNKWLMVLRKKKTQNSAVDLEGISEMESAVVEDIETSERYKLMRKGFEQLGVECQQVLTLFFDGHSMRQIAEKLSFTAAYAKKKKFICQKKLIDLVSADPSFQELYEK